MAESNTKAKLQLRSVSSFNGDKSPSPSGKLLINHGKPNFTIQRSTKSPENGDNENNPLSPKVNGNSNNNNNNNYYAYKNSNNNDVVIQGTKFNGVFNAAKVPLSDKQPHQQTAASTENEVAKVVLRPTKLPDPTIKDDEDENVPEFIRRQRRIQERLAKENVLDFENRRSGYFTHCMITPTSPNRTSFIETMASPAVVPALEIPPPPTQSTATATAAETTSVETSNNVQDLHDVNEEKHEHVETSVITNGGSTNGHVETETKPTTTTVEEQEEEEVAKAIEEVNKAVAGEDDDQKSNLEIETDINVEELGTPVVATLAHVEETIPTKENDKTDDNQVNTEEIVHATIAVATVEHNDVEKPIENGHVEAIVIEETKQNGHVETIVEHNGHTEVTISHTNSNNNGPCIPSPDPSGALGVNYEPKTVVSFSKDLGSEPNKYPDTVKVIKDGEAVPVSTIGSDDSELKELAKLKFDIKADDQDVQVTPVLRAE